MASCGVSVSVSVSAGAGAGEGVGARSMRHAACGAQHLPARAYDRTVLKTRVVAHAPRQAAVGLERPLVEVRRVTEEATRFEGARARREVLAVGEEGGFEGRGFLVRLVEGIMAGMVAGGEGGGEGGGAGGAQQGRSGAVVFPSRHSDPPRRAGRACRPHRRPGLPSGGPATTWPAESQGRSPRARAPPSPSYATARTWRVRCVPSFVELEYVYTSVYSVVFCKNL